jgi:hypothetical protein
MKRAVAIAVLATSAALLWAPLTVSAAASSSLSAAWVTPMSGTPATVFVLRVRFTGRNGARATSVSAAVEGLTIPMGLASGTAANGTWATSVRLPVGTWSTTFVSTASKGTSPSITGPTISVVAPNPAPAGAGNGSGGQGANPAAAKMQPTGAAAGGTGSPLVQPAPASGSPSTASPGDAAMGLAPSPPPGADASRGSPLPDNPDMALAMALAGMALVALAGLTAMMLAARNRELDRASALAGARDAEAALMARTIRRARLRAYDAGVRHITPPEDTDR